MYYWSSDEWCGVSTTHCGRDAENTPQKLSVKLQQKFEYSRLCGVNSRQLTTERSDPGDVFRKRRFHPTPRGRKKCVASAPKRREQLSSSLLSWRKPRCQTLKLRVRNATTRLHLPNGNKTTIENVTLLTQKDVNHVVTHDERTLGVHVVQVVRGNDLILRATNAARTIQFHSNLQQVDQCFAATALVLVERNRETEYRSPNGGTR